MIFPSQSSDHDSVPRPLDPDVERGLRWTAMRQIVSALAGMIGVLFYARFIRPGDLGEASLAVLIYEGMVLLIREPIGAAVIYYQTDETDHPGAAFWLLMAFSLPAAALVIAAAPWIAAFYGAPLVAGLIRAVTVAFLLTSLGTVPSALLLKQMRFPLRESFLTAYVLIEMAGWIAFSAMGFGAWSLILPAVIASGLWAAANWIVTRFKPVMWPGRAAFADIFRFSRKLLGSQLLAYLMDKMDNAAVGTLGQGQLGLYAFGEDQSSFATFGVATVAAQVMLPALARAQDNLEECRRVYLDMLRLTAAVSMPMQIGAIITADLGITLFFGSQWSGAVPVFRVYVAYQAITAFALLSDSAVSALGRPDIPLRLNLFQLPLFIAATWFGITAHPGLEVAGSAIWGSIVGVAIALAVVRSLAAAVYLGLTWRMLGLRASAAFKMLWPSVLAAGLMGLAALAVRSAVTAGGWLTLGAAIAAAAPLYFALLWLFDRAGFAALLRAGLQVFGLTRIAARIAGRSWPVKPGQSPP